MSEKIKESSGFEDEDDYEDRDLTSIFFFRVFPEGFISLFFNQKSEQGLF